jgi:hypothetical protein
VTDIENTNTLGKGTFNPCPASILFSEVIRLFTFARFEQGFMKRFRAHGDGAPRWIGACTVSLNRAGTTALLTELDVDDRLAVAIESRIPVPAGLARGTSRLLGVPINDKVVERKSLPFTGMPTRIRGYTSRERYRWRTRLGSCDMEFGES